MKYIVVTSANGKSFYLAEQAVAGAGYKVIATFTYDSAARKTADAMNRALEGANG